MCVYLLMMTPLVSALVIFSSCDKMCMSHSSSGYVVVFSGSGRVQTGHWQQLRRRCRCACIQLGEQRASSNALLEFFCKFCVFLTRTSCRLSLKCRSRIGIFSLSCFSRDLLLCVVVCGPSMLLTMARGTYIFLLWHLQSKKLRRNCSLRILLQESCLT